MRRNIETCVFIKIIGKRYNRNFESNALERAVTGVCKYKQRNVNLICDFNKLYILFYWCVIMC